MQIVVSVDGDVAEVLRRSGDRAQAVMRDGLDELGDALVAQARSLTGGGRFGRSFSAARSGDTAVIAGSTSPLASILEKGRKPGRRPPVSRRISPSAATKIAATGTKGNFVVKRAAAKVRADGTIKDVTRQVVVRITKG